MFPKMGSYFPFFFSSSFLHPRESQSAKDGERYAYLRAGERPGGRRAEGQSSQNTHSGFGNEAISLPATLRPFTPPPLLLASNQRPRPPACLPACPHLPPPQSASNRRVGWNFSGRGREKGIFLEITTGALRERNTLRARGCDRGRERETE